MYKQWGEGDERPLPIYPEYANTIIRRGKEEVEEAVINKNKRQSKGVFFKVKEVLKSKILLKVIIKIKEQQICCICHPLHLLDICAFWTCIYQPRNIQKKRTGSSDTSMVHN